MYILVYFFSGLASNRLELSPLSEMPDMMENPNYQLLSKQTTQSKYIITSQYKNSNITKMNTELIYQCH